MNNWLTLNKEQQINIFTQASAETGLPHFAIEKDAWVTLVLRILFASDLFEHLVFKGGTSLSKVYNLIDRFSEDIDLAINRDYFGFKGELTKGEIRKLRRRSHDFSIEKIPDILKVQFEEYGVDSGLYDISVPNVRISDQDPEVILVNYKSIFEEENYLPNRVQIEIGARSLNEPFSETQIGSLIDSYFKDVAFVEESFNVKSIIPEKTFLEKMMLLHEEFSKPEGKIRHLRMSRHLYDIFQIEKTEFGKKGIKDEGLFNKICKHRAVFTPVRGVDYDNMTINGLKFIPPDGLLDRYRSDYQEMQKSMIYGKSPGFEELIEHLKTIQTPD